MEILGFLVRIGVMLLDPISWIVAFVLVALLRGRLSVLAIAAIAAVLGGLILEVFVSSVDSLGRRFGRHLVYFVVVQALQSGLIAWLWQRWQPSQKDKDGGNG